MGGNGIARMLAIGGAAGVALLGQAGIGAALAPASVSRDQPMTGAAVVASAERLAGCSGCGSLSSGARPASGLAMVTISDSSGGGFAMIMGYSGSRWGLLQAGQDSPYLDRLPGRLVICQAPGNRTNVRSAPSIRASVVTKVSSPTNANSTAFRLSRSGTVSSTGKDGEGWYKVRVNGRSGWVAAKLTIRSGSGGCGAWLQWPWPDGTSKG